MSEEVFLEENWLDVELAPSGDTSFGYVTVTDISDKYSPYIKILVDEIEIGTMIKKLQFLQDSIISSTKKTQRETIKLTDMESIDFIPYFDKTDNRYYVKLLICDAFCDKYYYDSFTKSDLISIKNFLTVSLDSDKRVDRLSDELSNTFRLELNKIRNSKERDSGGFVFDIVYDSDYSEEYKLYDVTKSKLELIIETLDKVIQRL